MRCMQFRVGVGRMSVPAPPAAKHHVAAGYGAFMHLSQMNGGEMYLECALVTESFETNVTLNPLLPGCRIHKGGSKILVKRTVLTLGIHTSSSAGVFKRTSFWFSLVVST